MASSYQHLQTLLIRIPFILKAYIQDNIQPVSAKYSYPGEQGINPAFEALDQVKTGLALNEKRLFALRSDFVIATGVKNAYQEHNYRGLKNILPESSHNYVNWEDRYGHPSLVTPGEHYDGRVFYAGFVCQRAEYLEVFLSSGRFNRVDRTEEGIQPLSEEQRTIIETYLSLQFSKAYGEQTVVFYDTYPGKEDDEDSALFFRDQPFPLTKKSRAYTKASLTEAIELSETTLGFAQARQYLQANIPALQPKYSYENEGACLNPGFENIEQVSRPLQILEKRIWALRSDLILATGVKNAYQQEYGYQGLVDSFGKSSLDHLNWKDRYGHPTLAVPEGDYDGGILYAGYICQRKGYLQVYLASGRYDRHDLNSEQRAILEAYIAAQFQVAYGQQKIVFDFADPDNSYYHTTFFSNDLFSPDNPQRQYNQATIREILTNGLLSEDELADKDEDQSRKAVA